MGIKPVSYIGNNGHPHSHCHVKTLYELCCGCNGERTGDVSIPNCKPSAERVVANAGFPSVTVGSLTYPKRETAEEAEGGIVKEVP